MKPYKILSLFLIISLILTIYLSSAKHIAFNENFYKAEFSKNKVYDKIENADIIAKGLMGFFKNKNKIPLIFNEKEQSHLRDVKKLIEKGSTMLISLSLTNIILLSLLLFSSENKTKLLSKLTIFSGIFGLIIPLTIIVSEFSALFIKFHLIFFPHGNWQFSFASTLITLFPQQFFYGALIRIIINSVILSVALLIFGFVLSRISSN